MASVMPLSVGQGEQLGRLARLGEGLHDDGRGDASSGGERGEIGEGESAAQRSEHGMTVQERLGALGGVPHVLVRVDDWHRARAHRCAERESTGTALALIGEVSASRTGTRWRSPVR